MPTLPFLSRAQLVVQGGAPILGPDSEISDPLDVLEDVWQTANASSFADGLLRLAAGGYIVTDAMPLKSIAAEVATLIDGATGITLAGNVAGGVFVDAYILVEDGTLTANIDLDGDNAATDSFPYDPDEHRWWRLEYQGDELVASYSWDGINWASIAQAVVARGDELTASLWAQSTDEESFAEFDTFNYRVAGAPLEIPCSIWPATSSSVSRSGVHHTHTAEADYDFRDELTVDNRSLVLEEKRYKIIEATPMDLVEHVVLLLKHTPAAG